MIPAEASFEATIDAEAVHRFAELSGDRNPLHVDPEYASRTEFGRPIAHGALLLGLVSRLLGMYLPGRRCLILGMSVRFPNPAAYPVDVVVEGKLAAYSEERGSGIVRANVRDSSGTLLLESQVTFALHAVLGEDAALPIAPGREHASAVIAEGSSRRTLLVTGGTGGVGKEVVSQLSQTYDIVCLTRAHGAGDGSVTYINVDLEDSVALESALAGLDPSRFFGIVHMSVPGMRKQRLIDDGDELRRQLRHAVEVPIDLARWASRAGSQVRRLVLVGSTGGTKQPDVRAGAYALAKAAMEPLAGLLSHDLAAQHATVNLVRPGFMPTGLNQGVLSRTMLSIAGRAHSGALSQPSDVAALIAFLLGDSAAQINGSIVTVDGGVLPQ